MIALVRRIPRLLSRETSGGKFIPQVDGLRFFAIMSVLLYHIAGAYLQQAPKRFEPLAASTVGHPFRADNTNAFAAEHSRDLIGRILAEGYFGVQLFFAISGLIIATPFANSLLGGGKPVELGKFYLRRVTRLEPPYIINLVLFAGLMSLSAATRAGVDAGHFFASMFYVHNIVYGEGSTINPVAWSLEIEVQFYLLAPLFIQVFKIQNAWVRRGLLAGVIVAFGAMQSLRELDHHAPTTGLSFLTQGHWFFVGYLLADLSATTWRLREPKHRMFWDVAGTLAWGSMWFILAYRFAIDLVMPWVMLVAYTAAFRGRMWKAITSSPLLYIVGGMCYTIYLYHPITASMMVRYTARLGVTPWFGVNLIIQCVILTVFTLAVCSVLFVLFERPFMLRDWPARLAARLGLRTPPGPAPHAAEIGLQSQQLPSAETEVKTLPLGSSTPAALADPTVKSP